MKMSKIDELKKQNPLLGINLIDLINNLVSKPKYTEMMVNLIKNKFDSQESHINDIRNELIREYKMTEDKVNNMPFFEVLNYHRIISDFIGYSNYTTLTKFIEMNERKLIENSDLTSYKTFQELELQMSLADLKLVDKEMEKQIEKLFENDEWLVLKPLSYLSSKKYGASTKWCTSSDREPDYFYKYVKRGLLIYVINKKTGDKVAGFKNIDSSYERETSFWNITDQRVDSLETGLPNNIMDIFKDQFHNVKVTNWDSLTDEERNRQILWLENEYYGQKKSSGDRLMPRAAGMRAENPVRMLENIQVDLEAAINEVMTEERVEYDMEMEGPMSEMMVEESMPQFEEHITNRLHNIIEDLVDRRGGRVVQMYPDEGPTQAG
jgi:hypothetical protein